MTVMFNKTNSSEWSSSSIDSIWKEKPQETTYTKNTHIIGLGSTKGGSGKSTCACSIAASLSIKGYKVLIIDMDSPQYTTYKFFQNREKCIKNDVMIIKNVYFDISKIGYYAEYETYKDYLCELFDKENISNYDFVILDSGGYYNHLTKLIIELSSILITPMNLSAIDLNVLFNYNSINDEITEGQYTKFVKESKNPTKKLRWYVIPNRCHQIVTEYQKKCLNILYSLGDLLGYKVTSNIIDRSIYSQGFDRGITCFDSLHESFVFKQSEILILNARREINRITDRILEDINF